MERGWPRIQALARVVVAIVASRSITAAVAQAGCTGDLSLPCIYLDATTPGPSWTSVDGGQRCSSWQRPWSTSPIESCPQGRAAAAETPSGEGQSRSTVWHVPTGTQEIVSERADTLSERYSSDRSVHTGSSTGPRTFLCHCAERNLWNCADSAYGPTRGGHQWHVGPDAYDLGAGGWFALTGDHAPRHSSGRPNALACPKTAVSGSSTTACSSRSCWLASTDGTTFHGCCDFINGSCWLTARYGSQPRPDAALVTLWCNWYATATASWCRTAYTDAWPSTWWHTSRIPHGRPGPRAIWALLWHPFRGDPGWRSSNFFQHLPRGQSQESFGYTCATKKAYQDADQTDIGDTRAAEPKRQAREDERISGHPRGHGKGWDARDFGNRGSSGPWGTSDTSSSDWRAPVHGRGTGILRSPEAIWSASFPTTPGRRTRRQQCWYGRSPPCGNPGGNRRRDGRDHRRRSVISCRTASSSRLFLPFWDGRLSRPRVREFRLGGILEPKLRVGQCHLRDAWTCSEKRGCRSHTNSLSWCTVRVKFFFPRWKSLLQDPGVPLCSFSFFLYFDGSSKSFTLVQSSLPPTQRWICTGWCDRDSDSSSWGQQIHWAFESDCLLPPAMQPPTTLISSRTQCDSVLVCTLLCNPAGILAGTGERARNMYIGRSGVQASFPPTTGHSGISPRWAQCASIYGSRPVHKLCHGDAHCQRRSSAVDAFLAPHSKGLGPLDPSVFGYLCLLDVHSRVIPQPDPFPFGLNPPCLVLQGPPHWLDVHSCMISQHEYHAYSRGQIILAFVWAFGWLCEAYFRSLLLLVFAALLGAWNKPLPGRASPFGRLTGSASKLAPTHCLTALAVASPALPVLSWRIDLKRRPHTKHRCLKSRSCPYSGLWVRILLAVFGVTSAPTCVWAVPSEVKPVLQAAWQVSCGATSQIPSDVQPDPLGVGGPTIQEGYTEPLPDTYDLQDRFRGDWLGVAIYAPYFPTTAFALRVAPGASFEHVCRLIKTSGRLPCPQHDALVAVHPQVFPGSLSVLSFPSIISQGRRPHCAVVIDISRVGGTCYAATLPIDSRLEDLWCEIGQYMNVDIESEAVQVWIGDASLPASHAGIISVSHGTLVTVCRPIADRPIPPAAFYAADLLGSGNKWDKIEHMPRPSSAHCLAVACGLSLDPVVLAFFPRFFKQDIALQVSKLTAEQAAVTIVENDPPLDLKGEPCPQTALVLPKNEGSVVYFLDMRPIGIIPRLVTATESFPDLPQILQAADVEFPEGRCGELLSNFVKDNVQVLRIGSTVELAHKVFAVGWQEAFDGSPPTSSCPVPTFDPAEGANSAPGAPPTADGPPAPDATVNR